MPNQPDVTTLFRKLLDNTCSPEELELLMSLLSADVLQRDLAEQIRRHLGTPADPRAITPLIRGNLDGRLEQLLAGISKQQAARAPVLRLKPWRLIAAACIPAIVIGCAYLLVHNGSGKRALSVAVNTVPPDLKPATSRATLTLSDGQTIVLDSAAVGMVAKQQQVEIVKTEKGQLAYIGGGKNKNITVFNTVSTPPGGVFDVTLPDGTKVSLNAASSIRFPTGFHDSRREVQLTGEAYFDVAAAPQPFEVQVNDMHVEVLGTHFNVMAYADEETVKTTLLQGRVRVAKGGDSVILQPGDQASLRRAAGGIQVVQADEEEVMAWKNGRFRFNAADVSQIMRQVSRWYNIDVVYEGAIQKRSITGEASRNTSLSELLTVLRLNNVHVKREADKLVVMP